VVLEKSAHAPIAELPTPVVLVAKALLPKAVLIAILPPPIPTETLPFTSKSPFGC